MLEDVTLLYVEDDSQMQEYLKNILEDEVKQIYVASNGEEGLELYKEFKPDIVLSDINMPYMNGLQMSYAIKRIDQMQSIILLTALSDVEVLKEAIDIGVSSFIAKPITDIEKFFKTLSYEAQKVQEHKSALELKRINDNKEKLDLVLKMITSISHHWKQPLHLISLSASLIEFEQEQLENKNEKHIKMLHDICVQTQKLADTLNSIESLDFNDITLEQLDELISINNELEELENSSN
jgi:YesN/AraC family two-component response regulator